MKYFTKEELQCPCGCKGYNFDEKGMGTILDLIREELGEPIEINSACRCENHNIKVGGVIYSSHAIADNKQCTAVDIKCLNDGTRWKIFLLAKKYGIRRIGVGKTFLHLDYDQNKQQGKIWGY